MPKRKKQTNKLAISQNKLLISYFINHPNESIPHPIVVDSVTKEYFDKTGKVFRDPDRGIRKLHQQGLLLKDEKGVYRYDPLSVSHRDLEDFKPAMKEEIFKNDGYKCVICGQGRANGVEIHVDHIKPKDLGGKATLENGQTLCSRHNFLKKNFKQTETGKKLFIKLYELAKSEGDEALEKFCVEILDVFEKNGINGHIVWER